MKKYVYYMFTENICSACNPMQVIGFLQKYINFVKQWLTISQIEGNLVPEMSKSKFSCEDSIVSLSYLNLIGLENVVSQK